MYVAASRHSLIPDPYLLELNKLSPADSCASVATNDSNQRFHLSGQQTANSQDHTHNLAPWAEDRSPSGS